MRRNSRTTSAAAAAAAAAAAFFLPRSILTYTRIGFGGSRGRAASLSGLFVGPPSPVGQRKRRSPRGIDNALRRISRREIKVAPGTPIALHRIGCKSHRSSELR